MTTRIQIVENILSANDQIAESNRACLNQHHIFAINVLASPGAGKTSLILRTIESVSQNFRLAVVEGDTASVTIDSDKVRALGIPAVQINTGGGCHLDAVMLQSALNLLNLDEIDLLIVENVGNLVCPANFRLGVHKNILIASTPEGDDKPYKYPNIYRGLDALVINKIDLLPYLNFDLDYFRQGVEILNPGLEAFLLSCHTGDGFPDWVHWLNNQVKSFNP
jgi:hydrogenase nickel incorporation protein HypB